MVLGGKLRVAIESQQPQCIDTEVRVQRDDHQAIVRVDFLDIGGQLPSMGKYGENMHERTMDKVGGTSTDLIFNILDDKKIQI
ncbi:hypothetical protein TNCV_2877711 [Trichonephila clavipes]|uniref:Uncharacterized protein n=1 Tax=Trichonephila clavipes TaxID=2585209 RepID=A0A8X6W1L7_TRICX|nr:hypothetical protein TNCV_2877711 [Trichonephila clavipes]